MNGSRVIGPIIGSFLQVQFGTPSVFVLNAASFLLVIWALLSVRLPAPTVDVSEHTGLRRLLSGFTAARADRIVGRSLLIVFTYSLLSLVFVGQLPTIADRNLGIDTLSQQYGFLYTSFGFGALLGALSIGTVFSDRNMAKVVRAGLLTFAGFLALFAVIRTPALAYPSVALVGFSYFAVITSLSTVMQQRLDDTNRGRVMALWIMGFGGTVPIGNLLAGPVIDATSVTAVILFGAVVATALAFYARLEPADDAG
jgi:predicted MFS family arabinose efflux permease